VIQRIGAMKLIKKYCAFSQRESLRIDVFNQCFVRAEKKSRKTKKNVDAYKRSEAVAVAYPSEAKKNKGIATLIEYNADVVGMSAKKYVTSGINNQKYYR
jgi:hypothetical protein